MLCSARWQLIKAKSGRACDKSSLALRTCWPSQRRTQELCVSLPEKPMRVTAKGWPCLLLSGAMQCSCRQLQSAPWQALRVSESDTAMHTEQNCAQKQCNARCCANAAHASFKGNDQCEWQRLQCCEREVLCGALSCTAERCEDNI